MTYLTDHLPFASSSSPSSSSHGLPPPRSHLLVTDTLSSPAHFVLYHLMSAAALDKRRVSLLCPPFIGDDQNLAVAGGKINGLTRR